MDKLDKIALFSDNEMSKIDAEEMVDKTNELVDFANSGVIEPDLVVTVVANTSIEINDSEITHTISYQENASKFQKLWRYVGAKDSITDEVLVTGGDSESVYRTQDGIDFSGGWHGDEEFITLDIAIDGKFIDLTIDGVYKGSRFQKFNYANIYTVQNAGGTFPERQIECVRTHIITITKGQYKYYNKWRFTRATTTTQLYLGMYCIAPIFSSIFADKDIQGLSEGMRHNFDWNTGSALIINTDSATWIHPDKWTCDMKIDYHKVPSWFVKRLLINPSPSYNKAYFGQITGTSNIVSGDEFEVDFYVNFSKYN